jgi:hypothetical protein
MIVHFLLKHMYLCLWEIDLPIFLLLLLTHVGQSSEVTKFISYATKFNIVFTYVLYHMIRDPRMLQQSFFSRMKLKKITAMERRYLLTQLSALNIQQGEHGKQHFHSVPRNK